MNTILLIGWIGLIFGWLFMFIGMKLENEFLSKFISNYCFGFSLGMFVAGLISNCI